MEGSESDDNSADDLLQDGAKTDGSQVSKRDSLNSLPGSTHRIWYPEGMSYLSKVVLEILETERAYVNDLQEIIEGYLKCIIDTPEVAIKPADVCALFGNIEEIWRFNSELLKDLETHSDDAVEIAKCFPRHTHGFTDIYTEYCTSYPKSMEVLTKCMNRKGSGNFFRNRQTLLNHGLPLGSYLLKPVQRILKYHLLLKSMLKGYEGEEEGRVAISEGLALMESIGLHINEMKKKHEHAVRVQEIQSLLHNWRGDDLTTYGELVIEGEFRIAGAKGLRQLFLFDSMLIITKRRADGTYACKTFIECSNLMLIESIDGEPCSFHVIPFDSPKCQYTVQAKNVEQKREWTQTLKKQMMLTYNVEIPPKAMEIVMQLGQTDTKEDEDKPDTGSLKKQHHAPEYLEKQRKAIRRRSDGAQQKKQAKKSLQKRESAKNSPSFTDTPIRSPPTEKSTATPTRKDKRKPRSSSAGSSIGG
ncbi:PREDICTED: pleckstrin homology domain-containing family G member 3-like, partial [Priapulus caudatus]|uniref:Pleckstrin homology domain-containing family G member 3-like n=1 Tax=Priapulus caudatus TaxID=37621 RepID=A0ABM1E681_PRICU